jgi:hypothetical protein
MKNIIKILIFVAILMTLGLGAGVEDSAKATTGIKIATKINIFIMFFI